MDNEALVKMIRAGDGDKNDLMMELYRQNKGIISKMARKYQRGSVQADDLMQEGYFALLNAVNSYNEGAGSFLTWLNVHLQGTFSRCVYDYSTTVRLPVHRRDQVIKIRREIDRYYLIYGEEPSNKELSRIMGLDTDEIKTIRRLSENEIETSLDAPLNYQNSDGSRPSLADLIPSETDDATVSEDLLAENEIRNILWEEVEELPEVECKIIKGVYWDNLHLADLGQMLGITPQEVSSRKYKALYRLRKSRRRNLLYSCMEIYSAGLKGTGLGSFRNTGTSATERAALRLDAL